MTPEQIQAVLAKRKARLAAKAAPLANPFLKAGFKAIKIAAYVEKYPEAYAAMADQIKAFGCDDARKTFEWGLENMYRQDSQDFADFNEVVAQCDYCEASLLAGWEWGESPSGKTLCRLCEKSDIYTPPSTDDEDDIDIDT